MQCQNSDLLFSIDSINGIWYNGTLKINSLDNNFEYEVKGFLKGDYYSSWYLKDSIKSEVFFLRFLPQKNKIKVERLNRVERFLVCDSVFTQINNQ